MTSACLLAVWACTSAMAPLARPLHDVEYRLRLDDPARGQITVTTRFVLAWKPAQLHLEDRSVEVFAPGGGLPVLSRTARPEVGAPRFTAEDGSPLAAEQPAEGRWIVQTGGHATVQVERQLVIPDRTDGSTAQHPFASTLSPTSAVFHGVDLFLSPTAETVDLDAPAIQVRLESGAAWQMYSPFGRGRRLQAPGYRALQDNFLFVAPTPAVHQVVLDRESVTVVAGRDEFIAANRLLQQAGALVAEASATFGALTNGAYLVALQPLRDTAHRRVLSQRGASMDRSVVAYLDMGSSTAYAEHPLSVVGHEVAHWWNPRRMAFEKGMHPPWFTEGMPSYYEWLLLLRTGVIDLDYFAQALTDVWEHDRTMAGREDWDLERASAEFQHHAIAQQVVYRRGAVLGFLLDARLRRSGSSLDEVVQDLIARGVAHPGALRPRAILEAIQRRGGETLFDEVQAWLSTPGPLDLAAGLAELGYRMEMRPSPFLGISLAPGEEPVVAGVHPRGPARGRLRPGDVIVQFAGAAIRDVHDFQVALDAAPPGQPAELRVLRGDGEVDLRLVVGARGSPQAVREDADDRARAAREDLARSRQGD